MKKHLLENNLNALPDLTKAIIANAEECCKLEETKTNTLTCSIDNKYLHSKHNPRKEARRQIEEIISANTDEKKIYLFFGAGLGYTIQELLNLTSNATIVWMEPFPCILKQSFKLYDYSPALNDQRLKIILPPFAEEEMFKIFKGLANLPVNFVPHRGSLAWKKEEYGELRFIAERFFKKKDVNIATLSKFETIWTRNIIQNFPGLVNFAPIVNLFGIAKKLPIIVCAAGPSLFDDLFLLRKYRNEYILIAVDTAVTILHTCDIDPDIIYSVDPQYINTKYLEAYNGKAKIVFDPTSSYHTLHTNKFNNGFFTSSPFPLVKLLTNYIQEEIGQVDFGGSVSTNAVSLADLMDGQVFLIGQDLAFTNGHAHAKGAILEERLNHIENRYNRREKHNHKQLHWLPVKEIEGIRGNKFPTNEKMLIFQKWFSNHSVNKSWINLTSNGGTIPGIKNGRLDEFFGINQNSSLIEKVKEDIQKASRKTICLQKESFLQNLKIVAMELDQFKNILNEGVELSNKIYQMIRQDKIDPLKINHLLLKMSLIDELASSKKGLNELIGASMQRVVLMITEGYDSSLNNDEKANERLGSAKKSILLYEGLLNACNLNRKLLKKIILRFSSAFFI